MSGGGGVVWREPADRFGKGEAVSGSARRVGLGGVRTHQQRQQQQHRGWKERERDRETIGVVLGNREKGSRRGRLPSDVRSVGWTRGERGEETDGTDGFRRSGGGDSARHACEWVSRRRDRDRTPPDLSPSRSPRDTQSERESAAPRRARSTVISSVVDDPQIASRGVPWVFVRTRFSTLKIKNRAQCEFELWWSSGRASNPWRP